MWSKHKSMPNDHSWHDLTPHQLVDRDGMGIGMRVVALRDIEEGEEVFIDYGNEWQQSWDQYMQGWKAYIDENPEWSFKGPRI